MMPQNAPFTAAVDARFIFASGIGVYLRSSLREIMRQAPEIRFRLLVSPRDLQKVQELFPGAAIVENPLSPLGAANLFDRVRAASGAHVLWIPHFNFPLRFRGRTLVTLHDISIRHRRLAGSTAAYLYSRLVFPFLARKAGMIICDSEATRRDFLSYYKRKGSLITIPLGIAQRTSAARSLHDRPYILAVGNVKPHKNLRRLVEAFEILQNEIDHDLVIAGRIEGLRTVDRRLLEMVESNSRIVLTGFVPDEDLACWMQHASLFVFPSFFEGFGFPPLEAMAAGIPVACSDIPVVREVCGTVPEYFDPLDSSAIARAVRKCLGDPDRKDRMRTAGPEHAARFVWANTAEKTLALLRHTALSDRRNGPPVDYYRAVMREKSRGLTTRSGQAKPRVSVITITLNAQATLEGTIQSVLGQTYEDIEYIVIDGGSKDSTPEIIRKYAGQIAVHGAAPDAGISDAMNQALALASGEIVGIIHSDDWYEPDAVQQSVAALDNDPDAGYVCASLQYWKDGRKDAVFPSRPEKLGLDMTVNHATCFVRRVVYEACGLFKEEYPVAMDYEFFLRLKGLGVRGISLSRVTAHMRYGGTSDRKWAAGLFEMRRAQKEIFGFVPLYTLGFPLRFLRALAGRMLDRPLFHPLLKFYRTRISSFRRVYEQ